MRCITLECALWRRARTLVDAFACLLACLARLLVVWPFALFVSSCWFLLLVGVGFD